MVNKTPYAKLGGISLVYGKALLSHDLSFLCFLVMQKALQLTLFSSFSFFSTENLGRLMKVACQIFYIS